MSQKIKNWVLAAVARLLTPRGVVLGGLFFWITGMVLFLLVSFLAYRDAIGLSIESARNLVLTIQRDVERTIHLYDLSLEAVISGSKDPEIMALRPKLRDEVLFDRSATAQYFGAIVLVNAAGHLVARSVPASLSGDVDYAEGRSYLAHLKDPSLNFLLSPPHLAPASGRVVMTISRRIADPHGNFAGVVVGTINMDYFQSLLKGIDLQKYGSASIVMTDGTFMAREPYMASLIGKNYRNGDVFARFGNKSSGQFWAVASVDGVTRLHVFRRSPDFPLIIDVAPSREDILAAWSGRMWLTAILALLFTIVVLPATFLLARELRQRRDTVARLRLQAGQDPLTGLENRGSFDHEIMLACAAAERSGAPLSLLFIDFDHFKSYNDTYGHQAGDQVLKRVTAAAQQILRRPTDHFARYGGEELIVILPGTPVEGALVIAERMRACIEMLAIPHMGSRVGVVTVSIGVAGVVGKVTPDTLIRMADEALYAAKSDGRNTVAVYSPVKLVDEALAS